MKIAQLNMMLRIPQKHRTFLEQHGALEEFVDAKILGKNELAKWILLATAKDELNEMISFNRKYESIPSKKRQPSKMGADLKWTNQNRGSPEVTDKGSVFKPYAFEIEPTDSLLGKVAPNYQSNSQIDFGASTQSLEHTNRITRRSPGKKSVNQVNQLAKVHIKNLNFLDERKNLVFKPESQYNSGMNSLDRRPKTKQEVRATTILNTEHKVQLTS